MGTYRHIIEVEGRFIDNLTNSAGSASRAIGDVGEAAKKADREVDELGRSKANPQVGIDTSKFMGEMGKVDRLLNKFKSVHTAALNIKDSGTYKTLTKITGAAESLTKRTWQVGVGIIDKATAPIRALKNMLFSIPTLITAMVGAKAVQSSIVNPVMLADSIEQSKIAFESKLGSAAAAESFLQDIYKFDEKSPFDTTQIVGITQQMMNMGWTAENVLEDLGTIGDWSASLGKGTEGISQVTRAIGQMRMKGKLSSEEMLQLTEAGVDAWNYLAQNMGEDITTIREMAEDGEIAVDTAIQAIIAGMGEYSGAAVTQADRTVNGLIDQVMALFKTYVMLPWGEGLGAGLKDGLAVVRDLIDENKGALKELGETAKEIGRDLSTSFAEKVKNTVERFREITDSFEFKNADWKGKIGMLWKGVIADPFKEWFSELWSSEENVQKATEIGMSFAKGLTNGILTVLGVTDIFKDTGDEAETKGSNIAQGFAKGFVENFDVSAITDKFVEAIGNVWGALPWWAKTLLVGYGGSKLAIGGMNVISSVAGGIEGAKNLIGSASQMTGLLGFGTNAAINLGAGNLAGGASLGGAALSTIGLGATAGGIAAGASVIKGGADLYQAYRAHQEGDTVKRNANLASGGTTLGGVAAGAGIGAAIGSVVPVVGTAAGALIGAGIGGIAGWIGGDKWAKNIEAARYETEGLEDAAKEAETAEEQMAVQAEAMYRNAKRHFGEIKLSMEEIVALTDNIVWGDSKEYFDNFTAAAKTAEENLQALKTASQSADKWMWKAGLGVKFNADERESIVASFDEYIGAAQSYLENKHYEFQTSASVLLDLESEGGKAIIESGNAFYAAEQEKLGNLGAELSEKIRNALEDGVISTEPITLPDGTIQLSEMEEIISLQNQIAEITQKVSDAEANAELELIKVKFGAGNLDNESFENFLDTMSTTIEERMAAADQAFEVQVTNLALRYPDKGPEYDAELATLIAGYEAVVDEVKVKVRDVELNMIAEAYKDELGADVRQNLENVLNEVINTSKPLASIDDAELARWLGLDKIEGHEVTLDNIRGWLEHVLSQLDTMEVDTDALLGLGEVEIEGDVEGEIKKAYDMVTPEEVRADTIKMLLTGDAEVISQIDTTYLAQEFGLSPEYMTAILWQLTGDKTILEKIEILEEDFGIPPEESATVLWTLNGLLGQVNPIENPSPRRFGILPSQTFTQTINIKGVLGSTSLPSLGIQSYAQYRQSQLPGNNFRGGFVGGSTALEAFANGGFVSGGARLVKVAEEGTPEAIIPLGSHRRKRGIELWEKTGEMLGVAGFANGGFTRGNRDEGIRFRSYSGGESQVSNDVHVEMGGVSVTVQVDARGAENVVETIKAQSHEIAETVAGILADELGDQFSNTPRRAS